MRRSADAARSSARTVVRATVETVPQRPRPVQHRRPAPKRTPAELDGEARFPDVFEPAPAAPPEPVEPLPQSDAFPLPEPDPEPQLVVDEEITDQVDHGEPLELFRASATALRRTCCPTRRVLRRGKPAVDGSQEAERVARVLLGALTEHGVEARLVGTVSGPARHALRAAAGRRARRSRASPRCATTSPTRWPRPRSASSRRSPASRPSASRCRTARRTSSRSATSSATSSRPARAR